MPVQPAALQAQKDGAQIEVFRFEYRRIYNVPEDLAEFEKWKRGEPTAANDPENDYWGEVSDLRARGVRQLRVRVVDFPISDYLRYEIDFYKGSRQRGEEIMFVERAPAIDEMQSTVATQDFWLFDKSTVLLWKYDKKGRRDGQELANDHGTVAPYCKLRDGLLRRALDMDEFITRYPDSFAGLADRSRVSESAQGRHLAGPTAQ